MSNSGAIRAGRAYVEMYADGTPLRRGLKMAERQFKAFGAGVVGFGKQAAATAAGYLSADFLKGVAKSVIDTGTKLANMSAKTGAGVKALQTLGYAAERSGASLEDVGGAMTHIRDQIAAAAAGSDDALKSFALLGIDFGKLASMKPEDQFRTIAKAIAQIPHPAQKAYFATKLLGNADLVPLIGQFDELEQRANDLGIVMDSETATAAKSFSDSMKDLYAILENVAVTIASALAPTAKWLVGIAVEAAAAVRDWVKANMDLDAAALTVANSLSVAWARIKLAWAETVAGMTVMWDGFVGYLKSASVGVAVAISDGIISGINVVSQTIAASVNYIRHAYSSLIDWLASAFITVGETIAKAMVKAAAITVRAFASAVEQTFPLMSQLNPYLDTYKIKKDADEAEKKYLDSIGAFADDARNNSNNMGRQNRPADAIAPVFGNHLATILNSLLAGGGGQHKDLFAAVDQARRDLQSALDGSNKAIAKKADAAQDAAKKPGDLMGLASSVMGTFSANAVSGFSAGGSVFNSIKTATMQTAQNTLQIARKQPGIGVS